MSDSSETMDFSLVTVERDSRDLQLLGSRDCLNDQASGIEATNVCRLGGDYNKCPAGSRMEYGGEIQTIVADILCPIDSVSQSDWIEGSQKGLCGCQSLLKDRDCNVIEEEMDCECYACPFGLTLGFAYTCTTEIVGPCRSFDCFGVCNGKYDPGNLVEGNKETFAPTRMEGPYESSASRNGMVSNNVMGSAIMAVALLRMIF